ncbi:ABC transporter ATP-binding protein/permease [Numidum massiliense]|uniref:ABC transporter ATP-binding protein/permease n=1 Tax=Numidum massiliense TaxID=1522315 RepID=UPI0006D596B7|nr:ABC transporter ATP-binding protein/permease [Numidum massiliense]
MDRKRKLPSYDGVKRHFLALSVITLLQSGCIIVQAAWLARMVTALFYGESVANLYGDMFIFVSAFMGRSVLTFVRQKLAYRFADKTATRTRKKLLAKLFALGPRFARSEGTGKLVTLALEGVSQLRTYIELYLPRLVGTAILPVVIVAYVFWQDKMSAVLLIVTVPIIIVFMILLGLAAKKQMDKQWQSYRILSNHFVDTLRGLETLKFLGQSKRHKTAIARVSDQYRSATVRTLRVAFLSSFALDFFTSLAVAFVAVGLGWRLVDGTIGLSTALTVLILAPEYFLPIRDVGADFHATLDGQTAEENIEAILAHPTGEATGEATRVKPWGADSRLSLSGVTVAHRKGDDDRENEGVRTQQEPIRAKQERNGNESGDEAATSEAEDEQGTVFSLRDVSLDVQGTLKVGIVGASGAGKSTLIDVLGGFLHPSRGRITWDGTVRHSLNDGAWHAQTTYIPQHPYIFNATLGDNIRFYTPDASEEDVDRAVRAAGLERFVKTLPLGYDEVIGNGGRPLSGGQEQRVALARAFLSEPWIVLLDEPTAHLDVETEYELKQTMLQLFAGRLVFLATHRLHWMPHMDHIVVLQRGRVAESGTHAELVKKQGVYYNLIRSQVEGIR